MYFKVHYRSSIFWLIFWLIVFFPIAFVLLLTDCSFVINQKTYDLRYDGSRFWLGFWVLCFFPIAFILLFVNGYSVNVHSDSDKAEFVKATKTTYTVEDDYKPKG